MRKKSEEDKEIYDEDEFDMGRDQLPKKILHLDQDCLRIEVPIRSNMEWANRVFEQQMESGNSFKETKEHNSLVLKDPIDLSFIKETIPHTEPNEQLMDA